MQKIRWFFLILGMILAIALAVQNNAIATIKLLWFDQTMPLSVMLLSAAGIGFLFGALLTASMLRSRKKKKDKAKAKASIGKTAKSPQAVPPKPEVAQSEAGKPEAPSATGSEASSADAGSPNP